MKEILYRGISLLVDNVKQYINDVLNISQDDKVLYYDESNILENDDVCSVELIEYKDFKNLNITTKPVSKISYYNNELYIQYPKHNYIIVTTWTDEELSEMFGDDLDNSDILIVDKIWINRILDFENGIVNNENTIEYTFTKSLNPIIIDINEPITSLGMCCMGIDEDGLYSVSTVKTIDFSNCDMSAVTNVTYINYIYSILTGINFSNFNAPNLQSMSLMFCGTLLTIELNNFNTSNIINMTNMFGSCYVVQSLDLSSFDTSNVISMGSMFCGCESLQSLDLSSFDTFNVTNMLYIFNNCNSLITLNLSNWNLSNLTTVNGNMSYMFTNCTSLETIYMYNCDEATINKIISVKPEQTTIIS